MPSALDVWLGVEVPALVGLLVYAVGMTLAWVVAFLWRKLARW